MVDNNFDDEYVKSLSPKVIALYNAVTALSREGADLTQMKVSDIAAKAGIGKGTTYAYFKSREELIVKAILYNIYSHVQVIKNRIQQVDSFQEKVYVMLDTLFEAEGSDSNIFQRLMPLFRDLESFPLRFREEFVKCAPNMTQVEEMFRAILEVARKEGVIRDGIPMFYVRNAFVNVIMDYAFYKKQPDCKNMQVELSEEEVKQRLYENLVYMLRK